MNDELQIVIRLIIFVFHRTETSFAYIDMTRGKKHRKKGETSPSRNDELDSSISTSDTVLTICNIFDSNEIQELTRLFNASKLDECHSLAGAAALGKMEIAEKLIENNRSLETKTEGLTPLLWAVKLKQIKMAVFLILRGADAKAQDDAGNNFLILSLQTKDWTQDLFLELWREIKDSIQDVNATNKAGVGIIHLLVKNQWDRTLDSILMERSETINVNCATHKGVTALMMACSRHQEVSINALLNHDADLIIEDNRGCTAVCYAIAYFIQKRMKLPNKVIEAILNGLEKQSSLRSYVERKISLLMCTNEDLRRQAVSSFTVDVMTFMSRCQTNGVELLIELGIFKRIKTENKALDKFIDDHDYVLGLLNIVSEIVRFCDCCANGERTEKLIDEFHEADVPEACLNILKRLSECRYPKPFSHIVLMPILLTCFKSRTECWLKRNYKSLAIFHQRCISVPLPFRNVYPDKSHNEKIVKDIARFKSLMDSLQEETLKGKQSTSKKAKKYKQPLSGEGDELTSQESSSPPTGTTRTIPHLSLNQARLKRPNQPYNLVDSFRKGARREFDWSTCVASETEPLEGWSLEGDDVDDKRAVTNPQKDIKELIDRMDGKVKRIMAMFEREWQLEYAEGYLEATGEVEDCERLIRVLPGLEWKHWADVVSRWNQLKQKLKSVWFWNRKQCVLVAQKIDIYLNSIASEINVNRLNMTTNYIDVLQGRVSNFEYFNCTKEDLSVSPPSSFLLPLESELKSPSYDLDSKEDFNHLTKSVLEILGDCKELSLCEEAIVPKVSEFTCGVCRHLSDKFYPKEKCTDIGVKIKALKEKASLKQSSNQVKLPLVEDEAQFKISDVGSFGVLVMGLDSHTETPLAVKTVCSEDNELGSRQFSRILPPLVRLHSLNVLPYSHWLSKNDRIVLATPLCDKNVGEYIYFLKRNDRFTIPHARAMIKQVIKGLHYLHTQPTPVIHGNLKPSNILIDFHGNLRLADFGLHEILFRNSSPSISSMIWWAQESYTAYEKSRRLVVTKDSDMQTCGMILHYIITGGIHPFGNHPQDIIQCLKQGRPTVTRQSEEVSDLIRWSLSHEPNQRPNTHMMLAHVFHWDLEKRWKFILTCAGVPTGGKALSLPTQQLHASLDIQAKKFCVQTKWMTILEHHFNGRVPGFDTYPDSISGLLTMLRDTWPKSAAWFFLIFPLLPLTLFRLLEGSEWATHEDFSQFVPSLCDTL